MKRVADANSIARRARTDLGSGYFDQSINPDRRKRAHVRQLEALGYTVTLTQPA